MKPTLSDDDLITCYLDVCNQAIALNKDRFPFKQILGAAHQSEQGRAVQINIIDSHTRTLYHMMLDQEKIRATPCSENTKSGCKREWSIDKSYLEKVIQNPEEYTKNPAKINWEWLYDTSQN